MKPLRRTRLALLYLALVGCQREEKILYANEWTKKTKYWYP